MINIWKIYDHTDFINNASNIRAKFLQIEICTRDEGKFIPINIFPSIPITASIILLYYLSLIEFLFYNRQLKRTLLLFSLFLSQNVSQKREYAEPKI